MLKELGVAISTSPKTLSAVKDGVKVFVGISSSGKVSPSDVMYLAKILGISI